MAAINFYRLTQGRYDRMAHDPDSVYFTTDTCRLYIGDHNYSHGTSGDGHVIGGYAAKIKAYSGTGESFTLSLETLEDDPLDMSRFRIGDSIWINDSEDDPDSDDDGRLRWIRRTITAVDVDSATVVLDADLGRTSSLALDNDVAVCVVMDENRSDTPSSAGDFNFVTGERAFSSGSWNTVAGFGGQASGIGCFSIGTATDAEGVGSKALKDCCHAEGVRCTASGLFAHAEGSMTVASGDIAHAEGSMTVASGDSSHAEGHNTKATGRFAKASGSMTAANADGALAHGNNVTTNAKWSCVFGCHGVLENTPANESAFAIAGGEKDAPYLPFVFRCRKVRENPDYNPALDPSGSGTDSAGKDRIISVPAYSLLYSGRLIPATGRLDSAVAILDHDLHARWIVETQLQELRLENWEDGDSGEVVFSEVPPPIPEDWITCGDMVNTHPVNVLRIERVGDYVFCKLKFN